jgi:tetratricopeptide (TPR) repeat protein/tRNA A-37 threonylcarbamoyl transferase component Bud32
MPDENKCPHCGKPVPSTAPGGVCPECMLAVGLATQTEGPGAGAATPSPAEISALFPQLEILDCLGRGGMGVVYRARQPKLNRVVALKILAGEKDHDGKFAERFTREAQALARLNHPNIVTVHDFGEAGGHCYLLMEFVDGLSLRQLLQTGRMKPEQALAIVPKICEALQYAHELGIVHRDIKPENILLDKQGRVKIADFGIAKMLGVETGQPALTGAKDVVGTPHYMAPEQIEKPMEVDHRADIFSLGVVFYEMLTGELPLGKFAAPSKRVQVDVRLDEVVLRALEKEPALRYQQASALQTQVETIAATSTAKGASPVQERKKSMSNKKLIWIAIGVVATCLVLVVAVPFVIYAMAHRTLNGTFVVQRGTVINMSKVVEASQLTQRGWEQWKVQRLGEAARTFKKAVELDPNNVDAWNGLGWVTFNSGNRQEGEKAFQKVLELDPEHGAALNGLGQIYLSQKKYDEAETYLLKAAPQAPAAWYGLARIYLLQGKFDQAQEWAQKLVDSGQADDACKQMLEAAKAKQLSAQLRTLIEPR